MVRMGDQWKRLRSHVSAAVPFLQCTEKRLMTHAKNRFFDETIDLQCSLREKYVTVKNVRSIAKVNAVAPNKTREAAFTLAQMEEKSKINKKTCSKSWEMLLLEVLLD